VFSIEMTEQNKCSIDNGENCTPPLIGERRREAITAPSGLSSFPQINLVDFPDECNTSKMTSLGGKNSTIRPFEVVAGDGFRSLAQALIAVGVKYGQVAVKDV
jgi:hypothetical protein